MGNQYKKKILIVDDESRIRIMLRLILENRGYEVYEAENGLAGLNMVSQIIPDMVILDVMMPVMDGFEACSRIRSISQCPVIMLTAKGEDYDQVEGFECGADDYVVKPFTPMVLAARVEAQLRRSGSPANGRERHDYGELRIDPAAHDVFVQNESVPLNRKEFELLGFLADNYGISLSRDQILENVWGYDYLGSESTVDAHITRLRKKLGDCGEYIKTIRGYGYKFEVSNEKEHH